MSGREPKRFAPGRQPYDSLNGLRVGALAGGLLGALATWAIGSPPWPVFVFAILGGGFGYWSERREQ